VELLDIYPTLVELCGLPEPGHQLEGKSLTPLLRDSSAPWDRPAYSQVTRNVRDRGNRKLVMGRSVRTDRWRYNEWDDGKRGRELYDHDNDPHEYKNLAADQEHAKVVAEMKTLLQSGNTNRR
jgi:uncharacterized sulfatase